MEIRRPRQLPRRYTDLNTSVTSKRRGRGALRFQMEILIHGSMICLGGTSQMYLLPCVSECARMWNALGLTRGLLLCSGRQTGLPRGPRVNRKLTGAAGRARTTARNVDDS